MIRAPRRQPVEEPAVITLQAAYEWEVTDTWDPDERRRFWDAPNVPEHLRQMAAPDPRSVLVDDESRAQFDRDQALFDAQRVEWLRKEMKWRK